MRLLDAHRCRALLVVLLIGFTTLTVHASIHAQPDQQSCELCSGHFNPSHAIAPAAQELIVRSSAERTASFFPRTRHAEPLSSYRQRAPPVLS